MIPSLDRQKWIVRCLTYFISALVLSDIGAGRLKRVSSGSHEMSTLLLIRRGEERVVLSSSHYFTLTITMRGDHEKPNMLKFRIDIDLVPFQCSMPMP